MTLEGFLFLIVAAWIGCSASSVVLSRSLLRAALGLLFSLLGTALLYFLLGAEFLGAVQLMVYVGGTMVVVVFGGMMTTRGATSEGLKPVGLLVGGNLAVALFLLLVNISRTAGQRSEPQPQPTINELGQGFLGAGPANYLFPFEVISIHLLVVLIAAAYLARARRRGHAQ